MKCKVCGKLNHTGRGEEFGEGILLNPGVYVKDPPAYFCIRCATLISKAFMQLMNAGFKKELEYDPRIDGREKCALIFDKTSGRSHMVRRLIRGKSGKH